MYPVLVNRRFFLASTVVVGTTLTFPALANGPEAFIKTKQAELTRLLTAPKSPAVDAKLEAVFNSMLDYEALARLSLGKFWEERTAKERAEFTAVLKKLVQRAYRKNIQKTLNYEVSYKGEGSAKGGQLVRTVARNKKKPREQPISIDYVLHRVSDQWRIFDIVTEGSSLVNNYENQFRRIIKKQGFAELLKKMRAKADERGA